MAVDGDGGIVARGRVRPRSTAAVWNCAVTVTTTIRCSPVRCASRRALDGDSLEQLVGVYRRAPAQALARLHMLAAADLVADADDLGRPGRTPM